MLPTDQIYQRNFELAPVSLKLNLDLDEVTLLDPEGKDHELAVKNYKAAKATVDATKYSLAVGRLGVEFDKVGMGSQVGVRRARANKSLVGVRKLVVEMLKAGKAGALVVGESVGKPAIKLEVCMFMAPKDMALFFKWMTVGLEFLELC